MSDALGYAPGTFVQPRFGADEARISIRGSGIQRTFHGRGIVLLQDGVALNLSDGGFDMQAVEPLGLQHIEVMRGANALQYGATTLGGAINFVSPSGHTTDRLRLRGEAGSFDYYRLFGATGGVAGELDHAVSLSHAGQTEASAFYSYKTCFTPSSRCSTRSRTTTEWAALRHRFGARRAQEPLRRRRSVARRDDRRRPLRERRRGSGRPHGDERPGGIEHHALRREPALPRSTMGRGCRHPGDTRNTQARRWWRATERVVVLFRPESKPAATAHAHHGAAQRRIAESHDGGVSFEPSRLVAEPVCECCRPALAQMPGGRVFAAWRDARRNSAGEAVRDIGVAVYDRRLAPEVAARVAVADGWAYDACPHAGPAVAAVGNRLFLGWFSGQGPRPGLRLSYSDDGGRSFAASTELLADAHVLPSLLAFAPAAGRGLWIAWEDLREAQPKIQLGLLAATGRLSAPASRIEVVGRYPALAAADGRLYMVWTQGEDTRLLVVGNA